MLAESLYRLGATVAVYEPDPQAPLCQRTRYVTNAAWNDIEALRKFSQQCSRVTYEFENVESEPLQCMEFQLMPSMAVLAVAQHRAREKRFLRENGLPHVAFAEHVPDHPAILKTVRGGYDGKGQMRWTPGETPLSGPLVAEEIIDIEVEASCIVARSKTEEGVFPVFENEHRNHILDTTLVPASLPDEVLAAVQDVARETARKLDVTGLLTTEFFLTRHQPRRSPALQVDDWYLMVNELAPRPHNSGHVTRQACTFSQFDALARILLDVPLGQPRLLPGVWGMGKLLGEVYGTRSKLDLTPWAEHPTVREVCLYGKTQPRAGRKMGHFIVHGESRTAGLAEIAAFRAALTKT
jgi:5-(carboxyamino)imidazole ribonucleotide synthase